ncbi:MAG: hypothetical protein AAGM67_07410 [Bacteroidota bacterium]
MKLSRWILLGAGIVGIAAFFLPFFKLVNIGFIDVNISGQSLLGALAEAFDVGNFRGGKRLYKFLLDQWQSNQDVIDYAGYFGFLFVLLGPVYLLFFNLGYFFKGAFDRGSYRSGLVFLLIYTVIAAVGLYASGQYYNITLNFFKRAGLGYWLGAGAILIAWTTRFLKPKSTDTV